MEAEKGSGRPVVPRQCEGQVGRESSQCSPDGLVGLVAGQTESEGPRQGQQENKDWSCKEAVLKGMHRVPSAAAWWGMMRGGGRRCAGKAGEGEGLLHQAEAQRG